MTATDLVLITLSAVALHRIWNYEEVCSTARLWAGKLPYVRKIFLCPPCNALWLSGASTAMWVFFHPVILLCLCAYAATRFMAWAWPFIDVWSVGKRIEAVAKPQPAAPKPAKPFDRVVVILTALNDFSDSYSVSIDVLHQARAIAMQNPTWQVQVWMSEGAKQTGWTSMPENTLVRTIVPRISWKKDMPVDEPTVSRLLSFMRAELEKLPKTTVVIEHDLLFISWYTPFAEAIHKLGGDLLWFHIPHSMPGKRDGKHYALVNLPSGRHYLAPVALVETQRFIDYYATTSDRVIPIPNPFDPRMWGDVSKHVFDIVTKTKLMSYDYVQILPACSTRLEAKGFSSVSHVFHLLNQNYKAHLLVCNPNASTKLVAEARSRAEVAGLAADRLSFTSELVPERATAGLRAQDIKTLMSDYGNIFVFPSISESDSRVCMEAKLCRQYVVGNADVPALHAHSDTLAYFGVSPIINHDACLYAANRIMDQSVRLRASRHSGRDLEGIGDRWRTVITDARL